MRAENSLGEIVRIRHLIIGTLPRVSITSLNQDANMATNVDSDTLRLMVSPAKCHRWCGRISCFIKGVYTIGLCVSRFSSEKIYSTGRRQIGIKSHSQIIQRHLAPKKKNSGRNGSIARNCLNLLSVVRARQNSVKYHMRRPCTTKDAPTKQRGIRRTYLQVQKCGQSCVFSSIEARRVPAFTSKSPEEREFVVDSRASTHMPSKKVSSSDELDTSGTSTNSTVVGTTNGKVQTN